MKAKTETHAIYVSPDDDLQTILACFKLNRVSHLPVVQESRVIGMISKTDVVEALSELSSQSSGQMWSEICEQHRAKSLMIQPIVQAEVSESQETILNKLLDHQVSSVVIKKGDRLAGIVTDRDMLRFLADERLSQGLSPAETLGLQMVEWMEQKGLLRISKMLSDIGI